MFLESYPTKSSFLLPRCSNPDGFWDFLRAAFERRRHLGPGPLLWPRGRLETFPQRLGPRGPRVFWPPEKSRRSSRGRGKTPTEMRRASFFFKKKERIYISGFFQKPICQTHAVIEFLQTKSALIPPKKVEESRAFG